VGLFNSLWILASDSVKDGVGSSGRNEDSTIFSVYVSEGERLICIHHFHGRSLYPAMFTAIFWHSVRYKLKSVVSAQVLSDCG